MKPCLHRGYEHTVNIDLNKCNMHLHMLGNEISIVDYTGHLYLLQALLSTDFFVDSQAQTV